MQRVKLNYILILIPVICVLYLCISSFSYAKKIDKAMEHAQDVVDEFDEDGETDDVEGQGAIGLTILGMFGLFGSVALKALGIILAIYDFFLFLFSTIARFAFKPYGDSLLAYRILMTIVYIMLAIPLYLLLRSMFYYLSISLLIINVGIIAILIICGANTYTNRILV